MNFNIYHTLKTSLTAIVIVFALCFDTLHAQQIQGEASFGSFSQSLHAMQDQAKISVITGYTASGKLGSNTSVVQSGNQNVLNLNIKGNGNDVVTQQIGNGNLLNLDLLGNNSQYLLVQEGNENGLHMNNVTSSGIDFRVQQKNNGNSLTIMGGVTPLESMKIEQTGGMRIIVESGTLLGRP